MFCPKCGTKNDDTVQACTQCNYALSPITEAEIPLTQDEMYKALIGPKNQDYYLNEFAKFDADGKTSRSWHWPAFFITLYWLLYRKMWPSAVIYYFLPTFELIIIAILGGIFWAIFGASTPLAIFVVVLLLVMSIANFVLTAMYANALYYKHCKKEIARITARKSTKQKTLQQLTDNGGTSWIGILIIAIFVLFTLGIYAAIAIPAYQDYTTKARISAALSVEKMAAQSVSNYYQLHQKLPRDLAQAGFAESLPAHTSSIEVDQESGIITMVMATTPIKDQSLLLVPASDDLEQITWACHSEDIKEQYLPTECKH